MRSVAPCTTSTRPSGRVTDSLYLIYMRLTEMYLITAEACVELNELEETAQWMDKMYFAPIHQDEIRRNPNLEQNPLYGD